MIYRLSLSQRLTLVFTSIMLICAVTVSVVQIRSSKQYGDAMVQRLSLELASKIVKSESLIDASGQVISLTQMRCPYMATIRAAASKRYSAPRRFYITVSCMAICTLFCRAKI